jgi:hypothetical protein
LLQFKMTQIFLHDNRHRHAKSGREILRRHGLLLFRICQEAYQAGRKVLSIARLVEFDCKFFPFAHFAEVGKVRTEYGNAVGTRQMGNPAAAC